MRNAPFQPATDRTRRALLLSAAALPLAVRAGESRIAWTDVELIDGRTLRADDLRAGAVVVTIWASWCPFCGAQNPYVQKLYDDYRGRRLGVLAFSIDKSAQAARDYIARRGYTFPVAMTSAQVEQWFGRRRTLPETYVVNRAGEIVFVHRGEMFGEDIAALARFAGA